MHLYVKKAFSLVDTMVKSTHERKSLPRDDDGGNARLER
jgi:hypothetical protein